MDIENAARELLAHDGIFAAAISPSTEQTFAIADFDVDPDAATKHVNDKLMNLCSSVIGLHRRAGLQGMSRFVLNEDPFGQIGVVTNMLDGVLVAVVVQSGHNVCKSLQRMLKRAIGRARKGKRLRVATASAEAVA